MMITLWLSQPTSLAGRVLIGAITVGAASMVVWARRGLLSLWKFRFVYPQGSRREKIVSILGFSSLFAELAGGTYDVVSLSCETCMPHWMACIWWACAAVGLDGVIRVYIIGAVSR
jgi:hypothetical protein